MTLTPVPGDWAADYQLVFDAWNRLVKVIAATNSSTVADYAYDGMARRIRKTTDTETQNFYYSNAWQVLEARSESHSPSSSSEAGVPELTYFVWGARGVNDLILRTQETGEGPTQQLYALSDQWNVVAVADQTGTVQERYGYNAFGTTLIMTSSFANRLGSAFGWETTFGSYQLDQETGFYQVRNRYYHATLGVWLSRDPIEEAGGSNLYTYVLNNPQNATDPQGLMIPPFPHKSPNPNSLPRVPPGCACNAYGQGTILQWICNNAGNSPWANCVRACLLNDWDPCNKDYRSGLVPIHLNCWSACAGAT
jgi:RHS repeat-associated protein